MTDDLVGFKLECIDFLMSHDIIHIRLIIGHMLKCELKEVKRLGK